MAEQLGILVVDDEKDFARGLVRLLGAKFPNERINAVFSGDEALEVLRNHSVGLMLTDLNMPGMGGMELLSRVQDAFPKTTVIVLTAFGSIELAVQALKAGAYDFLTKPIEPDALYNVVSRGMERSRLLGENDRLKSLLAERRDKVELIGESAVMRRLKETIAAVAQSEYTVLIRGESGTGKELVARTVHSLSRRAGRPMLTVNCPAIPDQLLESELFGHVRGAFTGADKDRKGLFETASGGTLLLDEIGDISQAIQTKLLRCLQENEIRPVGSSRNIRTDVRILASTNQALEAKIEDRSFREDLYYRLNVLTVQVPPLRDRAEDIPLLTHHFLRQTCKEMRTDCKEIAPEALAYLSARSWPGNVRELQNFVRRLAVFSPENVIGMNLVRLVETQTGNPGAASAVASYHDAKAAVVDDFTRNYVQNLLSGTDGNITEAARISGLSRVALQKILKRLHISADMYR